MAVLEAMVGIPLGAVELVRQHSLLTVLPTVLSGDSHGQPGSRSSHLVLLSSVVKVVSALWLTLFESTTRKTIVADAVVGDPTDELMPEEEDATPGKRKRSSDTNQTKAKRMKPDPRSDLESSDTKLTSETEESKDADTPTEKLLPPLFIHEYLNTLMLLLPVITASSPPTTLATFLELVSEVVKYVEKVAELSSERQRIRLAALAPKTIKGQASGVMSSNYTFLSHFLFVIILGDKAGR